MKYKTFRNLVTLGGVAVFLMAVLVWRYLPEPRGKVVDENTDSPLELIACESGEPFVPSGITSKVKAVN